MKTLVLYATKHGQTEKIAERIAATLRTRYHQVTLHAVDALAADFAIVEFDAAIIGGSIYIGKYSKALTNFVRQHHDWLNAHPSGLFTVCMGINSTRPESRQEALGFAAKLSQATHWQPDQIATFAGAVKYTRYGWFIRLLMRNISKREGGRTDTSTDHEYTDWNAVEQFSEEFSERLAG